MCVCVCVCVVCVYMCVCVCVCVCVFCQVWFYMSPRSSFSFACLRVNNCVGENNQKYFVLFTVSDGAAPFVVLCPLAMLLLTSQLYIMLLSVHGLLTCLWFFIKCATQDFKGEESCCHGDTIMAACHISLHSTRMCCTVPRTSCLHPYLDGSLRRVPLCPVHLHDVLLPASLYSHG